MTDNAPSTGALFRSVDQASFVAALILQLRHAGMPTGPTAANRLAQAMRCCPPTDVNTLYWLTKTSLVSDRLDFPIFDQVFEALFGGIGLPIAPWERETGRATVKTTGSLLRQSSPTDGFAAMNARITRERPEIVEEAGQLADEDDAAIPELLPSSISDDVDTPFDQLSPEQLVVVGQWFEQAVADLPQRLSRRRSSANRGAVDLRRTMRSARTTGEVMTLTRHRPRLQPRPFVMLADVSGSMESFTRIYLHLMRAFAVSPARSVADRTEVFTFATSLRRATVQLRERDPQAAIDRLSDEVTDRFGGTRIAASIGELITSPRWSYAVRGATVIIASDGWDTDPSSVLAKRMARLQRMSHRVLWINPRVASTDYAPVVEGMAAALPYVDDFLSGHSLRAMRDVISALSQR